MVKVEQNIPEKMGQGREQEASRVGPLTDVKVVPFGKDCKR